MKGAKRVVLRARTDKERVSEAQLEVTDCDPTEPEHLNWKLKPRMKSLEIGPEFRHNSTIQSARLIETLNSERFNQLSTHGLAEGDKAVKQFVKTGSYKLSSGYKQPRINSAYYVVKPKQILNELHTKTHFRATKSIA